MARYGDGMGQVREGWSDGRRQRHPRKGERQIAPSKTAGQRGDLAWPNGGSFREAASRREETVGASDACRQLRLGLSGGMGGSSASRSFMSA